MSHTIYPESVHTIPMTSQAMAPTTARTTPVAVAPPTATPAVASRVEWIDVAKASAIVLVVFYHVGAAAAYQLLPGSTSPIVADWRTFNRSLIPLRMPLFFMASGLLATAAIQRPWRQLWRRRVGNLLWPFLLWSVLFAVLCAPRYLPGDPRAYAEQSLATIPFGGTAYWFLSVLVVIFVLTRLMRKASYVLLLLSLVAVGVAPLVTPYLVDNFDVPEALAVNVSRVCFFAIWFVLGCICRPVVVRIANAVRPSTLIASVALFAVLLYAVYFAGVATTIINSLSPVMSILGLVAALQLSVLASRSGRVRRLTRYLASRTLAIYVLHPILLSVFVVAIRRSDGTTVLPLDNVLIDIFLFPILTVALVAAAVGTYDLAQRVGARWLFALPGGGPAKKSKTKQEPAPSSERSVVSG